MESSSRNGGEDEGASSAFPPIRPAEAGDLIAFLFTQNYFEGFGNVDSGKKLFNKKGCIQCHQIGGVGGVLGPSLDAVGQSGAPMNVAAAMWNHGPPWLRPCGSGYRKAQSQCVRVAGSVAYLRAAPERAGAPVSILPGRVNGGRALFEKKQCIKCHSIQGKGGNIGPDLGRRGLYRNLVEFAAALWNKAPAMLKAMKLRKFTVPQLNGEEMADIVAYLRSFQYFGGPESRSWSPVVVGKAMPQLPFAGWQRRQGSAGLSYDKGAGLAGRGHRCAVEPWRFDDGIRAGTKSFLAAIEI